MQSNQEIDLYPSRTKRTMLQIYQSLQNDFDSYDYTCENEYLQDNEQSNAQYRAKFTNFEKYMNTITRYVENYIMRTDDFHSLSKQFKVNLLRHIKLRGRFVHYYASVRHAARSYGHSNNSTHNATIRAAQQAHDAINRFDNLLNNYYYSNQDFTF